jgi:hypothetical protein
MSVIFAINRDFPYQVALSFDEIAMEVLAWLDEHSFDWDMYVDCHRVRFAIASARRQTQRHLTRGSRVRSKGELSAASRTAGRLP